MEDAKDFHVQENLMTTHSSSPNGTVSQNQKKLRKKNMENSNERFLDRKSLLADKKELTDNDIDTILELSSEEINISSLENFTHKKFNDLSISEKADLISKLENADYKKYKNSFLSTSKLLYEKSETLSKEIKILKTLDELNYSIYLLPYGYARNNQDFMQKTTDSILKHKFLEMKSVSSSGKNAGYNAFRESKKQAENAILSFEQDISPETALNNIQRSLGAMIKGYKERGLNYDMSGSVFLHFEKTGVTKLYEINKDGKTKELNVKAFGLKNARELDKNSQVEAEVTAKPIEQPMNTIPQNKHLSNQQSQEENNMPEQNTIHTFTDDEKKMSDFNELTKREFLDSHSDVKESDYDATVAELKEKGEYTAPWNTIKKILGTSGRAFANEMQYQRELHQNDDYTNDADGNFMRKFDAAYFTIERYISHHGLDMNTYRDLFGDISEETATEIEDEKRDILGPEVVEELVKGALDFEDFLDIQQAYDRALVKSNTYLKYAQAELTEAIGKQDNLFVNNIADYLNSAMRYYEEIREPTIAEKCEDILSEALFTAETEVNTVAFRTLLDNGADITYRKTEVSDGKEYKANILHYIAADDNTEALSLIMDDAPSGKHFNRLTAGEKLSLLREQNFEGRTPLEVSENHYKEEPSRYEPDMIMPDVMRELAYQEEDLMSHVPPLVLTDKITGNILMIEQANGDGCEINLFDKNKKLVDHDISAGYTNNLGESVDYKSSLEAARVSMAEYEKQSLWGNFYEYEKLPATVSQIQALRDSRDEFFKTLDAFDKNLNPKLSEIDNESSFSPASVRFTSFIPKEVLDKLGIDTEENEDFYRLEISLAKDGKLNDWYLDSGSAMTGVGENIEVDFSEEEKKKFNFIFEKVYDAIRKKYPSIEKLVDLKERDSRTVTQSVTFPAHFIDAEKQSITLLEKMQDKYGFGENDFEKFVNDGDVDIHFAAPVPKEYQFPKSKTDEWIKAVCKDLEENFGSTDVSAGMDGSERTETVFDTAEDAEKFVAEKPELTTYHILKESDVNREMAFSEEGNTVATVGVAPTIQTLRTRVSSTALRTSATTVDESIIPQTEKSSEMQFKDFVKEVELEYKDLRLFRKATVNVLKRLPPEQKSAVKAELLKRGANNPESLALVMKEEVQKQHSQKKNQERNRNRNTYEPER